MGVIGVIFGTVSICLFDRRSSDLLGNAHVGNGAPDAEISGRFNVNAHHIWSSCKDIICTFSDDHAGFGVCQIPDDLFLIGEQCIIRNEFLIVRYIFSGTRQSFHQTCIGSSLANLFIDLLEQTLVQPTELRSQRQNTVFITVNT